MRYSVALRFSGWGCSREAERAVGLGDSAMESMVGYIRELPIAVGCVGCGDGRGITFSWCMKIQKTSFVTLTISRHQTL